MNIRVRIATATVGCLLAAAPAIAQNGAKLAVGPEAGGYLCPDGRQVYVKSCYDNSPNAQCGVVLMHLPTQNGFQRESTEARSQLTPSLAACKVYPLEFRNDGTVGLVLPKSPPPQQAAKAPAATPPPKAASEPLSTTPASTAARPPTNPPPIQAPARRWGRVEYVGEYISRIGDMKVEYLGDYISRIGDMHVEYRGEYISRVGDMTVEYRGEYISRIGDMRVEYLGEYIYRIGD